MDTIFSNLVRSRKIEFKVDELRAKLGPPPHRLVHPDCFRATLTAEPGQPVILTLECFCDKETLRELAPDLAEAIEKQPEFRSIPIPT